MKISFGSVFLLLVIFVCFFSILFSDLMRSSKTSFVMDM